jgi:hypothetical protein
MNLVMKKFVDDHEAMEGDVQLPSGRINSITFGVTKAQVCDLSVHAPLPSAFPSPLVHRRTSCSRPSWKS